MRRVIGLLILLLLLIFPYVVLAGTFSSSFNDFIGFEQVGGWTNPTYSWAATDDSVNKKACVNCSGSIQENLLQAADSYKFSLYNTQKAQILMKAPSNISDHVFLGVQAKTSRDDDDYYVAGQFYGAILIRGDTRCASDSNLYFAIEKAYYGETTSSSCDGTDPSGRVTCLFDCKQVTFDTGAVYLIEIETNNASDRMDIHTKLSTVVGTTPTPVANSDYSDYNGGTEGSPVVGERWLIGSWQYISPFLVYFDQFNVSYDNAKTFSTSFNDWTGVEQIGNWTAPAYSWAATDDVTNKKACANCSGIGEFSLLESTDSNRFYFYDSQTAKVLFKAPNGLTDHIFMGIQLRSLRDGGTDWPFYAANVIRDTRCGDEANIYLAIEKSYFGSTTNAQCIEGTGGQTTTCLFDCKQITYDNSAVYLLKVTTDYTLYDRMEINAELFTVSGTTATPVTSSRYVDYFGGTEGDPITGMRWGIGAVEESTSYPIYFDKLGVTYKNDNNLLDSYSNIEAFNLATKTAGAVGYAFGSIEGRYLYPAPCYYNTGGNIGIHGIMARYDKSKRFDLSAGWETYDVATNVDADMKGYHGNTSDSTFIYYAPLWKSYVDSTLNDTVARYTISDNFNTGWTHYHLTAKNAGASGYVGNTKAGKWIYFVPYGLLVYGTTLETTQNHGIVIRYDTTLPFTEDASWEVYDLSNIDSNLKGYHLACQDDTYVYLNPFANWFSGSLPNYHGKVVRHKISEPLNTGWEWIDIASYGGNAWAVGIYGCAVAGDYVYFPSNVTHLVARYTRQTGSPTGPVETTFTDISNWQFQWVDYVSGFPSGATTGYAGIDYINGYVSFAPDFDVDTGNYTHGWVARHDITQPWVAWNENPQYPSLGWEFMNLKNKNSSLDGQHGLTVDPVTGDFYSIPVRHLSGSYTPVYHGYFSRHIFK